MKFTSLIFKKANDRKMKNTLTKGCIQRIMSRRKKEPLVLLRKHFHKSIYNSLQNAMRSSNFHASTCTQVCTTVVQFVAQVEDVFGFISDIFAGSFGISASSMFEYELLDNKSGRWLLSLHGLLVWLSEWLAIVQKGMLGKVDC